ncbi:uncharacterized protein LOC132277927 [Cornus florida]|uniref:uncharacterized protein LOC132277927 n=1 Tax=Cornus florida TaxID=4283 RepID=UPI00289C5D0F|nr:uncharacterized protein LOC132277927 [Cornus florida]
MFSVFVNGSPTGFFASSRGLRQGDPLSSFLFLIVIERLSRLMKRAEDLGFIRGFRVGREAANQIEISHLLFADDTLVFCDTNVSQLRYLGCILTCFQAVSGLQINVGKRVIILVGDVLDISSLAAVLGCGVGAFPLPYLGLPLGVSSRIMGNWDPVINRFHALSLNGLKKFSVTFFAVEEERNSNIMLIGTKALLGKWLWRFGKERHRQWRRVVSCRFGEESGGWSSRPIFVMGDVGVWKFIRKMCFPPTSDSKFAMQMMVRNTCDRRRWFTSRTTDAVSNTTDVESNVFSSNAAGDANNVEDPRKCL